MSYLGIVQTNHGSSAAVYDGKRLVAANEERFDRIKFSNRFPHRSISWCLQETGLALPDLAGVGFYFTGVNYMESARSDENNMLQYYPKAHYSVLSELLKRNGAPGAGEGIRHVRQTVDFFDGKKLDIFFPDHHLTHAAGSFLTSGYESAAILCMDGTGDGASMSMARGRGNDIEILYRQPFPHSLGQFYATFTQLLGFQYNSDEYKVMGLAAYGDPGVYYDRLLKLIRLEPGGGFELDMQYFKFNMVTSPLKYSPRLLELLDLEPNRDTEGMAQPYRDLAAGVQAVTEDVLRHVLAGLRKRSGEDVLCYGGGVALNCLANGRVFPQVGFKDYYITPNPGDGGLAAGTCAYLLHCLDGAPREFVYDRDDLGPQYSEDEIKSTLDENGIKYTEPADLPKAAAERLAAGKVVGLFRGRQEFGPRALGCRSILADPRPAEMKDVVNRKIKFREPFRPFAPSALADKSGELFKQRPEADQPRAPESFMLCAVPVRDEWRDKLGATTHEDGSARLQNVFEENNKEYYDIISAFDQETGVPAVMNTSFNVKNEPIVLTPQDAVRCFYSTGMDALAAGPFLVEK